jgi:hypothetical protein
VSSSFQALKFTARIDHAVKKSKYTDEHFGFALKQAETGAPAAEILCRTEASAQEAQAQRQRRRPRQLPG